MKTTSVEPRSELSKAIFALDKAIRYVAIYFEDKLEIAQREEVSDASQPETDRYEELLVNPTILKLADQRGKIDCGGLDFVLVGYGSFNQLVFPLDGGHISVAIEKKANALSYVEVLRDLIESRNRAN